MNVGKYTKLVPWIRHGYHFPFELFMTLTWTSVLGGLQIACFFWAQNCMDGSYLHFSTMGILKSTWRMGSQDVT